MPNLSSEAKQQIIDSAVKYLPSGVNGIVFDKPLEDYYASLYAYFKRDAEFETLPGCSLDKGLLIEGDIGVGKTLSMYIMRSIFKAPFRIVAAEHIIRDYRNDGDEAIDKYGRYSFRKMGMGNQGLDHANPITYMIDDIGLREQASRSYGNSSMVIGEVIRDRYRSFTEYKMMTHATTNQTPDEIEALYGADVRDRMREMMNLIILTGESHRK